MPERVLALALVAILNVCLNCGLIPGYGAIGAAVAASVTEVILFLSYLLSVCQRAGNPLKYEDVWKPAVSAVMMGGVNLLLWQPPSVLLISLAILAYGAGGCLLKSFSSQELYAVWVLLNRAVRAPSAALRRGTAGHLVSPLVTEQDK